MTSTIQTESLTTDTHEALPYWHIRQVITFKAGGSALKWTFAQKEQITFIVHASGFI